MSLARMLALSLLQAAPSPDDDVVGRWFDTSHELLIERGGKGTYADADGQVTLTWTFASNGLLTLTFPDGQAARCTFTRVRDRVGCRLKEGWLFPANLEKEGWRPKPPPPPYVPPPCNVHVVEGVSAGPIRLGMKAAELGKLPIKLTLEPKTPEWLSGGHYRVRLSPAGLVAEVRVEASEELSLCVDAAEQPPSGSCSVDLGGGSGVVECLPRGVRSVRSPYRLEWVEVFPPVAPRILGPDECTVLVKPGQSAGPLRLGMSRAEAAKAGLGLREAYPNGGVLHARPYTVTFGGRGDTVSSIRLDVSELGKAERACLASQPLGSAWRPAELCTRGFCGCSVTQAALPRGTTHASCPEGIAFDFSAPGALFLLEITPKR